MTWLKDSNTKLNKPTVSNPVEAVVMKPCPFCGGVVSWCCCGPEGCHQITCSNCGNFDLANGLGDDGDTLEELRKSLTYKWNKRTS